MRITNNIGYLLQHLAFTLGRQSDQVLQETLGIGFSQFKILMALKWRQGVQQKQIAERLGQTEASISRQIKLMHEQGLLSTIINPANRREHRTNLTPKGVKIIDAALETLNTYHLPTFERLTPNEQEELIKILGKMHEEVCSSDKLGACHDLG